MPDPIAELASLRAQVAQLNAFAAQQQQQQQQHALQAGQQAAGAIPPAPSSAPQAGSAPTQ